MSTTATAVETLPTASVAPRPVPFFRGARVVFDLSLEAMLWSRRSLFMGMLFLLPVVFAFIYRLVLAAKLSVSITPFDLYGVVAGYYYIWFALPLTALFYATALVADEVESRTITYLLTRPVRRGAILAGKFGAYLATTLALAWPGLVVTFFLLMTRQGRRGLAAGAPDLVRDLGMVALGLLAYGALFTLIGVLLKWPLITGLLFVYGWEFLSLAPGWAPRVTIRAWLNSLHRHHPAGEGIAQGVNQALPVVPAIIVLGVASVVFLALAAWTFSRRQYVLDQ